MKTRAHVVVRLEGNPGTGQLETQAISIVSGFPVSSPPHCEISAEWFRMTGNTYAEAYKNCVDSIAFSLIATDSMMRSVLRACTPTLRGEVIGAIHQMDPNQTVTLEDL